MEKLLPSLPAPVFKMLASSFVLSTARKSSLLLYRVGHKDLPHFEEV
jgi:hypothetical protein